MRRMLLVSSIVAALAAPALPRPALAQPPGGVPRPAVQRLAQAVQRRLGLTEDQAARLRATTGRFASQRQQLMVREREARRALRLRTEGADSADQSAIARDLDELLRIQTRRVEILAEEQRELARFLTPLQRAQYLALQERAFRAAQQQRLKRPPGAPLGGRRPQP